MTNCVVQMKQSRAISISHFCMVDVLSLWYSHLRWQKFAANIESGIVSYLRTLLTTLNRFRSKSARVMYDSTEYTCIACHEKHHAVMQKYVQCSLRKIISFRHISNTPTEQIQQVWNFLNPSVFSSANSGPPLIHLHPIFFPPASSHPIHPALSRSGVTSILPPRAMRG